MPPCFSRWLFPVVLGVFLPGSVAGSLLRAAEPVAVRVSVPVIREVTDYKDFVGRVSAVQTVDIRARVTGFLERSRFKEGAEVRRGDLLFEIDPRPYQARCDQAEAQVALAQAQLKLAKTTYARDQALAKAGGGAITQRQLDQDQAAVDEATARLRVFQAIGTSLQARSQLHQSCVPHRWSHQPSLCRSGQPGEAGRHRSDDRGLDRPDLRLLRYG